MSESTEKIAKLSDDDLLNEMMAWFRVYRNEGELKDDERKYFQNICSEIRERELIDVDKMLIINE